MAQVTTMDPLTLEVFSSRLISVANEQATALVRTSFSPPLAESRARTASGFDARADLLAQAAIGGHVFSADARELFEERLFIPITRLFVEGRQNNELLQIIQANIRAPREVTAELYSMSAANEVGAERLREFMDEQSLNTIEP